MIAESMGHVALTLEKIEKVKALGFSVDISADYLSVYKYDGDKLILWHNFKDFGQFLIWVGFLDSLIENDELFAFIGRIR